MALRIEDCALAGPVDRWRALRDEIHADVVAKDFDPALNSFVQYYGSVDLDASLLMIRLVGFLPATEPREIFERLLLVRNDVGLLAEQSDPVARRLLGNFPQALSHVGLVNTARNPTACGGPAERRPAG